MVCTRMLRGQILSGGMLKKIENRTYEDNEKTQNIREVSEELGKEYRICAALQVANSNYGKGDR